MREAVGSHGIGSDFGGGWLDRLVGHIYFLPRPMALSLRNTFRRKSRVALTLITLTLSGAIFTMVLSADGSFSHTLVSSFDRGEDISISLDRPYRISHLTEIAESVPGVTRAEVWSGQGAMLASSSGEGHPIDLKGVPSDSAMFYPRLVRGRGLLPEEGKALLIDNRLAEEEGIRVGDEITVSIDGDETAWTVVGTYLSLNALSDDLFVPQDALARATGTFARGETVMALSKSDDIKSQGQLIQALRAAYTVQNIEVIGSWSTSQQLQESLSSFAVMTVLLLTMVILTAVVGGIGLMSTMSLNVVERRREIGVMRATGASSLTIVGIFVAEGVLVGVMSWLLAVPLSIPGARLFSDLIGDVVLQLALDFEYATGGMLLWLLIVVVLSALASLWPALRAAQVSVREALTYE